MQLARVVGNVHATQKDANIKGAKMLILQPINAAREASGSLLAAVDTVGAGPGEIVYFTTAYEAVIPWYRLNPDVNMALIDASVVGIVDRIDWTGPRP